MVLETNTVYLDVSLLTFFSPFVFFSSYCVAGTVGHKLMSGKATKVDVDRDTQVDVRCKVLITSDLLNFFLQHVC